MADQNALLKLLVRCDPPECSLDELVEVTKTPKTRNARTALSGMLGRLMKKKLVERARDCEPQLSRENYNRRVAMYRATGKGRALAATGKRLTLGPAKGTPVVGRQPRKNTFRMRLWTALRIKRRVTVPELIELAVAGTKLKDSAALRGNTRCYLNMLSCAGIVTALPTSELGYCGQPLRRWALVRDLGPRTPEEKATGIRDPNSGTLIAYRTWPRKKMRRAA